MIMPTVQAATTKNIVRVSLRRVGVADAVSTPIIVKVGTPRLKIIAVARQGISGTSGGGLSALAEDTTPQLGGNLVLGAFNIVGQLENQTFILDGGLIEG